MNRKLSSLVIFLFVLFLGGSAQAFQKFWWSNAGTNHLWDNLSNYWNIKLNPPTIADFVGLDSPVPCYALIDVNTNAQCLELSVGSWAHYPAYDLNGLATLDVNEGTLTVATQLSIGERTSIAGNVTMGDVNILAGSVTVDTNMYIGREGIGMLNMRGGTLDINGTLWCPGGPLPPYNGQNYVCGTGMLNLYGGIISAGDFDVYASDITQINVEGGTLIVGGDKTSKVIDLVGQGKLYAYNGQGELILDYNITNTGKTTITASYDPNLAFGPSPIDYAINVTYNAQLQWAPGAYAASHNIYFGTSFSDVNNANPSSTGIYEGNQPRDSNSYNPGTLESGWTYYWRIDEVNGPTTWKGYVWSFTVRNAEIAAYPSPADGAQNVAASATFVWAPGIAAVSHNVYLGFSFNDVNNATTSSTGIYKGSRDVNNYDPCGLLVDKTYYWRIDEVNGPNTWKGNVWSFDTAQMTTIDNFESYNVNPITNAWYDGSYNGTRSVVSLFTSGDSPKTDGNAMKVDYSNNSSPYYAEVSYAVPLGQRNWTLGGVKILGISFHGVQTNAVEQLYVALEDADSNATVLYADSNQIIQQDREYWRWWTVDMKRFSDAGVDLNDVRKLVIGLGDKQAPGGSGTVYFDNIALYHPMCLAFNNDADLNNDCVVNSKDLLILATDWLNSGYDVNSTAASSTGLVVWYKFDEKSGYDVHDSSGNGYDGYIEWESWDPCGYDGNGGLNLDGYTFVEVPLQAADVNLGGKSTVCLWVKDNGQSGQVTLFQIGTGTGNKVQVNSIYSGYFAYICGWDAVKQLEDKLTWGSLGYTNPEHVQGQWNHYAFVKDYTKGTMWIYHNGKIVTQQAAYGPGMQISEFVPDTHFFSIGCWRAGSTGGYYVGIIDDFRLYNRALSQAEILDLADVNNLHQPVFSRANVNTDDIVNFKDFAVMAHIWMAVPLWP